MGAQHRRHRRHTGSDPNQRRNPRATAARPAGQRSRHDRRQNRRNKTPLDLQQQRIRGTQRRESPPKFAYLGAVGVESSLASGVITYGATSYVPQTGRPLQAEAVQAPGLPDGSGAGAAYTMQEEPWNMQGAAREAAEAPGLEAAREQAAFDAALAAAASVDPSEMLSLADARIKGEQFLEIKTVAEIIDVIGSIPDGLQSKVEGAIADTFSVDVGLDWYHQAGQKLVECSTLYSKGF